MTQRDADAYLDPFEPPAIQPADPPDEHEPPVPPDPFPNLSGDDDRPIEIPIPGGDQRY